MVSLGMLDARALSMAVRRRGLPSGSPPPLAATVISLSSLVHPFDFLASEAALVCLIFDQRLWPDIDYLVSGFERGLGITRLIVTQAAPGYARRVRFYRRWLGYAALFACAACAGPILELPPPRPVNAKPAPAPVLPEVAPELRARVFKIE